MPPIKPKYSLSNIESSPKAGKKFTDREEFLAAFYNTFETKVKNAHKVIVYYGVGGIGKTALCKELIKRIEEEKPNTVWAAIDFDTPMFREQETALFILRNVLNEKFQVPFPAFDIAYTVYWQKTHPQIPLVKDNFPLLNDENVVNDIVKKYGEIPFIGFVHKLTQTFSQDGNVYNEWWRIRGKKELANLPALEPTEIFAHLSIFWASDLRSYLEKEKKQAVLFLDTYDSLWENVFAEGGFFMRDEWIREMVSSLPEVIWVIYGREKLRWNEQDKKWDEHIHQLLLGRLSDEDSKYFLLSCGVEKSDVQKVIIKASEGVPYFLDLAVDTYYEIFEKHGREPVTEDFAKIQRNVFERFFRYLDRTEIETLKILSCARVWDRSIFQILMKEFKTGYPVSEMDKLFRFSFIEKDEHTGHFSMHDLMREGLQLRIDKDILELVHKSLFEYYNSFLTKLELKNISELEKKALIEAFYHSKTALEPVVLCDWFHKIRAIFFDAVQYKIILPLTEEFVKITKDNFGEESFEHYKALRKHVNGLIELGKHKVAEPLLLKALNFYEKNISENKFELGLGLFDTACLYYFQGRFSEAEPNYKRALEIFGKEHKKEDKSIAYALNNLGVIYAVQGKYDKSIQLFKQRLEIQERIFGKENFEIARSFINLANISLDFRNFSESEAYAKKALEVYQKTLGEFHPENGKALNTLGNIYIEQGKYTEAQPYFERAKKIFEETYGDEHTEVAITLNNLAYLNYKLEKYNDALSLYQKALAIYKEHMGPEHPNIANIIGNIALIYKIKKEYKESEELFEQAISILLKTVGELNSDTADTYEHYAKLLEEENNIEKAIEYYKKSLVSFEASLGLDHYRTIEMREKVKILKALI